MSGFTMQDASRRSGLPEPTVRYYEQVGLIGPIDRDEQSGHRRFAEHDVAELEVLACLRATGVGIADMRSYQANRGRGGPGAADQRELLLRHAERVEAELDARRRRLAYLRAKAALWDARARSDADAEQAATTEVLRAADGLEVRR